MTMTMTPERLAELDADASKIGLPICPEWTYSAIRHCQRNMDIDVTAGFNEPDRQCGGSIAEIVNAYPDLRAHIDAQAATIARYKGALERIADGDGIGGADAELQCADIALAALGAA